MLRSSVQSAVKAAPRASPRSNNTAAKASRRATLRGTFEQVRHISDSEAITAYRRFGHLLATIDPLARRAGDVADAPVAEAAALLAEAAKALPANVADLYTSTYCGNIGIEFEHIESASERAWWSSAIEGASGVDGSQPWDITPAERRNALTLLQKAETFELFLGKKFPSFKRYSGEGTEGVLLAADAVFAASARAGVRDAVVGEAHRGRLAMLTCLLDYPARKLLWKIAGNDDIPASVQGLDDVSSHVYTSVAKVYPSAVPSAAAPGTAATGTSTSSGSIKVSLLPNPSHLEAVNPVAAGKVRAKRDVEPSGDALCVLVHGDAACSGQGIVAECYQMANLPGYTVGGTVHIIANNQIGYTAEGSASGRSSRYASDFSKTIGCPVLHVNGESPRDIALACTLAVAYRQAYHKDVVLDIIGYRRHGHNEVDEPSFTNPGLYASVRARPSFAVSYGQRLVAAGEASEASIASLKGKLEAHLEAEFQASKGFSAEGGCLGVGKGDLGSGTHVVGDGTAFNGLWAGMRLATPAEMHLQPHTGVEVSTLRRVAAASVAVPPGFSVHERLVRSYVKPRAELAVPAAGGPAGVADTAPAVDWSTAEALAFGSMLLQGHSVRISGQDVERGTFSQRHAVLVDQKTGSKHTSLNSLKEQPGGGSASAVGTFHPVSSLLSELAVMGYELGYSWESPNQFVAWEAQFGDFVNGAQIILDQFLGSSETKWLRQTGLTLLLPHGYDGAGPEHSSGRIERFLQMANSQAWARDAAFAGAANDKSVQEALNVRIAVPTTPANYFHLLRRQVASPWRKPLVVFTPKVLLRAPAAMSALQDMGPGTAFTPVLQDVWPCGAEALPSGGKTGGAAVFDSRDPATASSVTRVLLCSGKIYHELAKRRQTLLADTAGSTSTAAARETAAQTAILRIEELAPWPTASILAALSAFPRTAQVGWVQEEPANAGAWTWAEAHMLPVLRSLAGQLGGPTGATLSYYGRPALAAPAVGMGKRNKAQQEALLEAVFPSH